MSTKVFKLDDSVLRRIVQIVQEGFLMGTDVSDGMRMLRLSGSEKDESVLVLTEEYSKMIADQHDRLVEEVEELKASDDEDSPEEE